MKLSKLILLIFLLGLCTPLAFAQGQVFKYVPQAVSKGTKTIPAPIKPKLPPNVRAKFAMPVVRPQENRIPPTLPTTIKRTATTHAMAQMPMPSAPLLNALQKDFLTGPQALIAYIPDWKRELGGIMFNDAQLNIIEQTFKETDKQLFKLDENGHWLAPVEGSVEWEYKRWYAQKLNESLEKFGDAELKTLFGKFARFDEVFTRLNLQAFLLIHKRAPKTDAPGEEGKLARHVIYNIKKYHPGPNPETRGYILARVASLLNKPTASAKQARNTAPEIEPKPTDVGNGSLNFEPIHAYYPAWRQELGGMFSKEQLDAVEKAFAATDDWIFVQGEGGELTIRNKDEWDYEARFLTILQNSGISFTDRQIKQLIGGRGIKGFTFGRYFTLKKAQTFCYAYGRTPRQGIRGQDGKLLTLPDLRKRAKGGDPEAAALAYELELGKLVNNALQNWPQDSQEFIELHTLYQQFRNTDTSAQVLAKFKQFIEQYGRAPRQSMSKAGKLLTLPDLRKRAKGGDPEAAALAYELELGKLVNNALQNWPQDSQEFIELNALYQQFRNQKAPETPAQVLAKLEQFIEQYGRAPRQSIQGEDGKLLTLSELRRLTRKGNTDAAALADELKLGQQLNKALQSWPNDLPERIKLDALYQQFRNRKAPETPAQVLAKLEQFIEQYGRAPRQGISEDGKLLTLSELRRLAEGGDPEAATLAEELELGYQISNALQNWPKDLPEYYKELKAIYDRFRK